MTGGHQFVPTFILKEIYGNDNRQGSFKALRQKYVNVPIQVPTCVKIKLQND